MKTLKELNSFSMIFSLKEDGIIEIKPIPGWRETPTLAHAVKDMECLNVLSDGKRYPTLCYLPDAIITREMRNYYSNHEPLALAAAMIVRSPFQRILGNFFIGLNKVKVPIRLFTSDTEARTWLLKLLSESQPPQKKYALA
ncbi:MAG TPA: hypothetical protein VNZ86_10170 [Bacteroidia bacterium]|jgi:hypothetical protein|nr:hypothetical protein [Bacteroidia bacterium]